MSDILVDTYKLNQYAQRIETVNRRISRIDWRLDNLYFRVGLLDLWKLKQAEALTCYSWRLSRCKSYLKNTATDFEKVERSLNNEDFFPLGKKLTSGIKELVFDVGVAVKKSVKKVNSVIEKTVTDMFVSYYSHGTVYKIVQYGKATVAAAMGVAKIVSGVASIFGTGGMSAPVAVLAIISGGNDVLNAIMDATHTYTEEYDKIGQNMLKDRLTEGGKIIGEAFGNEKMGELFGVATYYGIDIVTSLESLSLSMDKIKQLSSVKKGELVKEVKGLFNLDVSKLLTTDIETLRYQTKLASYTFKETSKVVSTAGVLFEVGEKAVDVGRGINDIFAEYSGGFENPVLKFIDKASSIKYFVKGSTYLATTDVEDLISSGKRVDSIFVYKKNESFLQNGIFFSEDFLNFKDDIGKSIKTIDSTVKSGTKLLK